MNKLIWLFGISMLPVIELRGAIPAAAAMDLPFWEAYIVSVLGNALPVPFLIFFSKKIIIWCAKQKYIGGFFSRVIEKADRKARELGKYELVGLCLFVAIPLPGTGAWTGSLIAAILRLRWKSAFATIFVGVMISGLIMGAVSYGIFSLGDFINHIILG